MDPSIETDEANYVGESAICIRNNGEDISFVNLNVGDDTEGLKDLKKSFDRDAGKFDCTLESLDTESTKEVAAT